MKVKSIISICNAEKGVDIYGVGEGYEQFFAANNAMYLMSGLPKLGEDEIYMLFGIPLDKQEKFNVSIAEGYPKRFDLSSRTDDVMVARSSIKIRSFGGEYEPIGTSQGIVYISTRYLAPFDDFKEGVQLYERIDRYGKIYLVVKSGFMVVGIICPEAITNAWLCESLGKLAELTKAAFDNGQGIVEEV